MEAVMVKDSRFGELPDTRQGEQIPPSERHPLFGALKGMTFVPPGVDLTAPADPDWGKVHEPRSPDRAEPNPGPVDPLAR
jgi:hypothetical protein